MIHRLAFFFIIMRKKIILLPQKSAFNECEISHCKKREQSKWPTLYITLLVDEMRHLPTMVYRRQKIMHSNTFRGTAHRVRGWVNRYPRLFQDRKTWHLIPLHQKAYLNAFEVTWATT